MLAIVVVILATARARQIVLNMLMVAFLNVGCRSRAAASAQLYPPTVLAARAGSYFGRVVGRLAARKMIQAVWMRYAASADSCTRIPLQRNRRRLADSPKVVR
jgi:hypothetical protein